MTSESQPTTVVIRGLCVDGIEREERLLLSGDETVTTQHCYAGALNPPGPQGEVAEVFVSGASASGTITVADD